MKYSGDNPCSLGLSGLAGGKASAGDIVIPPRVCRPDYVRISIAEYLGDMHLAVSGMPESLFLKSGMVCGLTEGGMSARGPIGGMRGATGCGDRWRRRP
ncbi:MAG: hypothetical protein OXC54_11240, partial [Rhodospirillaceae bacterium]|nr:hypothetical protein [Rhodospirillaceae bacterium]